MTRGDGSLFLATRRGVTILGLPLIASVALAPTWWAHHSVSAWTAAWLNIRGRACLGPRELLADPSWSAPVTWLDHGGGYKRSGHRPDLVALMPDDEYIAIEVELAAKSRRRLDAILGVHHSWIETRRSVGVVYVCRDDETVDRITGACNRVGFRRDRTRFELLDQVKAQTRAAAKPVRDAVEAAAG